MITAGGIDELYVAFFFLQYQQLPGIHPVMQCGIHLGIELAAGQDIHQPEQTVKALQFLLPVRNVTAQGRGEAFDADLGL